MENLSNQEKNDSILTERMTLWDAKINEVKKYKDRANNEMDEGMLETVVALNLLGISTIQSCAGHIESSMMPWVQIHQPNRPEGIYEKSDITPEFEEWIKKRELLGEKVEQLLTEYNQHLKNNKGLMLTLDISYNIKFTSEEIEKMFEHDPVGILPLTKDERKKMREFIPAAQEELKFFKDFLKEKYFKE